MQFILILLVTALACVTAASRSAPPVVAIVSHPYNSTHEYIATSYIKNMELAGARVVRVPYNGMDEDGLDWIKKNTNGLFLMGGGSSLTDGVKELFKTVREIDGYPIWGTCLGFEWIMQMISEDTSIIGSKFDAENYTIPLNLTDAASNSRLFNSGEGKEWSVDVKTLVSGYPVTLNNHEHGVSVSDFKASDKLTDFFDLLSTNADRAGLEFVSSVESKDPSDMIYATQWHPEKNTFEYGVQPDIGVDAMAEDIDHSEQARRVTFEMANFFVQQMQNDGKYEGAGFKVLALDESSGRIKGSSFEERLVFWN